MKWLPRLAAVILVGIILGPAGGISAAPERSSLSTFAEPDARTGPVLALIRSARHSIRLEVYLLTNRTIIGALSQARSRGIAVRVLLEQHPYGADRYAQLGFDDLRRGGVSVRWANEAAFTYTHEKAMVIDGTVAGIFTFNLSTSGLLSNREFGVIDHDRRDAATIAAVFDADWNRRSYRPSDPDLVISPVTARPGIDNLIDGSRHTLDLYEEEIDDLGVEAHLEAAVRRHVRVRLITSADSPGVDALRRSGVAVQIMAQPYVHAKAIVADNARVFIGSENISATSLDHNREMGIVTGDAGALRVVEDTFAQDWRGAVPPPPPSGKSGSLGVRVTAEPASIRRGRRLTIRATTSPGALCSIRVTYPDGYVSRARSLAQTETADSSGAVTWSWDVGSTVNGTSRADVTCTLSGRTATGSTTFVIEP
jgi:phosphatidylserine/phosphatidylglycerophosphate/cardiolipin synthase-like enzyme